MKRKSASCGTQLSLGWVNHNSQNPSQFPASPVTGQWAWTEVWQVSLDQPESGVTSFFDWLTAWVAWLKLRNDLHILFEEIILLVH